MEKYHSNYPNRPAVRRILHKKTIQWTFAAVVVAASWLSTDCVEASSGGNFTVGLKVVGCLRQPAPELTQQEEAEEPA